MPFFYTYLVNHFSKLSTINYTISSTTSIIITVEDRVTFPSSAGLLTFCLLSHFLCKIYVATQTYLFFNTLDSFTFIYSFKMKTCFPSCIFLIWIYPICILLLNLLHTSINIPNMEKFDNLFIVHEKSIIINTGYHPIYGYLHFKQAAFAI